ncbi:MAG: glycosyltransferase 87 family protein [Actinobacteria bacterium]|nr:glycosyltransferase 87 family protein [Actinomycetota bacterium]
MTAFRGVKWWWILAGLATAVRLVLAFTLGTNGDITHMLWVALVLRDEPLNAYSAQGSVLSWPYLPGYFPVVLGIRELSEATGASFAAIARLPVIAANIGLAWLVDAELRRRAAAESTRLLAALVLLFSPLLVLESGWHAQLDIVATLLAVAGVVAWGRVATERRAFAAGALIGGAIAVKTVPGVVGIALLPHARDRRELASLVATMAAVPFVLALPWILHDVHAISYRAGHYRGLPGLGGLSLLIQPHTAELWFNGASLPLSHWQRELQHHASLIAYTGILIASAVVLLRRPPPAVGAVLLLLAVYAAAANWTPYYLLWILPFLILAGWARAAVLSQLVLLIPLVPWYDRAIAQSPIHIDSKLVTMGAYVPAMLALWLTTVVGACVLGWRLMARPRAEHMS